MGLTMEFQLCVTPERRPKTARIMMALKGSLDGAVTLANPERDKPFVVWGHRWLGANVVPQAWEKGTPFFFIDNGYHEPANGLVSGYYSLTYRSFSPMLLDSPDMTRSPVKMLDWKPVSHSNGVVLLCVPGQWFGRMFNWNMQNWVNHVVDSLRKLTDREVVIRDKTSDVPLSHDLRRTAVLVTHSSKSAIEAILKGIPCIVEPLNPAAPVCGTSLAQIENPPMPDRKHWWASLMCQQFTLDELRMGRGRQWLNQAIVQGQRDMMPGLPKYSALIPGLETTEVPPLPPDTISIVVQKGQRLFVNGFEVQIPTKHNRGARQRVGIGRNPAPDRTSLPD